MIQPIISTRWKLPLNLNTCVVAVLAVVTIGPAAAQDVSSYFPRLVPGFDRELGITVMTRVRPLYDDVGTRFGGFVFNGGLDESLGYNDNLLGLQSDQGNWFMETSPSLSVNSDWSRNRVGASLVVDNLHFYNQPVESFTNLTAALGGSYVIGRGELTVAYAHLNQHQLPTEVGASATSTPVPYSVDDVRGYYALDLGRFKITPNVDYSFFRYGDTTILGAPSEQSFRNKDVIAGGVTAQYDLAPERSLLVVAQGFNSQFVQSVGNSPSLSSNSALILAGFDYLYDGVWRYRLLAGTEARKFASSQFRTRVAAIGEGQIVWTPTNLLTLTGTASRTIEDPNQEASSGFTYSSLKLVADYEYRRNILLQGQMALRLADNLQGGGTERSYSGIAQISWRLNRNVWLSSSYSHITQNGSVLTNGSDISNPSLLTTGSFSQNIVLVTLRFRL